MVVTAKKAPAERRVVALIFLGISSCFTVGTKVPIVSSAEAPAPAAGKGWYCFERRTGSSPPSSTCTREESACQEASKSIDGVVLFGVATIAGKCTPRSIAACRHVWFADSSKNTHECFRSISECRYDAERRVDSAVRQSACAEHS